MSGQRDPMWELLGGKPAPEPLKLDFPTKAELDAILREQRESAEEQLLADGTHYMAADGQVLPKPTTIYGRPVKLTFINALTLLFIALKLTNQIDWSWWLVLSPMLVCLALIVLGTVCAALLRIFETPAERSARLLREMSNRLSNR